MVRQRTRRALIVVLAVALVGLSGAPSATAEDRDPTRIIGGSNAAPGEFPYQVALIDGFSAGIFQFCGGSLIAPTVVLTAAHCVYGETPASVDVLSNTHLLSSGGTRTLVDAIHMHPSYDHFTAAWDFAVLELDSPAPGTPIAFAGPGQGGYYSTGTMATVTGWGNTVFPGSSYPDSLKKVQVPVVSNAACSDSYGPNFQSASMICAGYPEGGKDACQGDSGGPIVVPGPGGARLQFGVVSWGWDCAAPDWYGVYSRISAAHTWISSFLPSCEPFPDVPLDHPFCADIQWLDSEGITGGFPDGTYRPGANITRGSMAAFLYRYAGSPAFSAPATPSFSDVPTGHTFYKEIEWAVSVGLTTGFDDGTFRPGNAITRGSMAAFLFRDADPEFSVPGSATFSDVPTGHTFFTEIEWLAETEVTTGYDDGTYRPGSPVTRGSFAAFLHRYDMLPA